jgi:hypothetical protein
LNRTERRRLQFQGKPRALAPSASSAAPIDAPPVVEEKPDTIVIRTAAISMVLPYQVYNGRLQNPDAVLRKYGGGGSVVFYRVMLEENLALSADCSQWEDRVNAIDLTIRPGDPNSQMSVDMAADVTRIHNRLQGVSIVNTWITRARWYGFTAIGKAGWRKDDQTGIIAPFDLHNIDPWLFKFGPNFEPYLLTQRNQWHGEPIPPRSVFFPRWGSLFTAYGESDLRDVYLSAWYIQNVQEMLLHSIEHLGRPVPWIEVGDMDGDEFTEFESGIAAQYKYYVITRTPGAKVATTFPNMTALSSGAVGKSEQEFIRYHAGLQSRKVFGTQQTQDRVGGSRALEESRLSVASDKTPPASEMRDKAWTEGWLNDISLINWPNQPRQIWPVMNSDVGNDAEPLTGDQIEQLGNVGHQLRLNFITKTWAIEILMRAGFKEAKAVRMVNSIADSKEISREPMLVPSPAARTREKAA